MTREQFLDLINSYSEWLKNSLKDEMLIPVFSEFVGSGCCCQIDFPYFELNGGNMSVIVKNIDDVLILSDGDGVLDNNVRLKLKISDEYKDILERFNLKVEDGELTTIATPENFCKRLHNLIQGIIFISGMALVYR